MCRTVRKVDACRTLALVWLRASRMVMPVRRASVAGNARRVRAPVRTSDSPPGVTTKPVRTVGAATSEQRCGGYSGFVDARLPTLTEVVLAASALAELRHGNRKAGRRDAEGVYRRFVFRLQA